jgi:CSLREA domain-containing protein
VILVLLASLGLVVSSPPIAAQDPVFTVTSVADDGDSNPGDLLCQSGPAASPGPCTLRAAIEEANAIPGNIRRTIRFGGAAATTAISVTRPLPTITSELIIDARPQLLGTQPGVPPQPSVVIRGNDRGRTGHPTVSG